MKFPILAASLLSATVALSACSDNEQTSEVETQQPAAEAITETAPQPDNDTAADAGTQNEDSSAQSGDEPSAGETGFSIAEVAALLASGGDPRAAVDALLEGKSVKQVNDMAITLISDKTPEGKKLYFTVVDAANQKFDNHIFKVRAGMAYKSGYGVEADRAKALELLSDERVNEGKSVLYHRAVILLDDEFAGADKEAGRALLEKSAGMDFAPAKRMLEKLMESDG